MSRPVYIYIYIYQLCGLYFRYKQDIRRWPETANYSIKHERSCSGIAITTHLPTSSSQNIFRLPTFISNARARTTGVICLKFNVYPKIIFYSCEKPRSILIGTGVGTDYSEFTSTTGPRTVPVNYYICTMSYYNVFYIYIFHFFFLLFLQLVVQRRILPILLRRMLKSFRIFIT